jgi:hypothetical protein
MCSSSGKLYCTCSLIWCFPCVYASMNIRCSKHAEYKKNWIKTLILKSAFRWLTLQYCITMHGTKQHKIYRVRLSLVPSYEAGNLAGWTYCWHTHTQSIRTQRIISAGTIKIMNDNELLLQTMHTKISNTISINFYFYVFHPVVHKLYQVGPEDSSVNRNT